MIIESISRLKAEIDELQSYLNGQVFIHGKELDQVYHDHEHDYRLRKLEDSIKRVFQPAFYVDVTHENNCIATLDSIMHRLSPRSTSVMPIG